jgi:argininosuccinate lyase
VDVRGRRLRKRSDEVTAFTSSMALDGQIAKAVIKVNMAHMVALIEGGEVGPKIGGRCLGFLLRASPTPKANTLAEDFHQYLEQQAVDTIGIDTAGYLNLGKSRNDQVATAIRMKLRERIADLISEMLELQRALLAIASKQGENMVPGYTHVQRAQPITLAHHYLSYFDSSERNVQRLLQLYARVNISPMGSAALGGTSVNVDRVRVAKLLGFDGTTANAMDSVASRDLLSEALACCAMIMVDVSRLSEEIVIWSSKEFGFIEVSDEYATSSSIMPQKKNPVVAEVARSKLGSVLGALVATLSIAKSLPFAYNMDLQEATLHLWNGLDDTISSAKMMAGMLRTMRFNFDAIRKSMVNDYSTATNLANHLVSAFGISFRTAHAIVGELVRASMDEHISLERAAARHMGAVSSKMGKRIVIEEKEASAVLDPSRFLSEIRTKGGSNPSFIPAEVRSRSRLLKSSEDSLSDIAKSVTASERLLMRTVKRHATGVKR